MRLCIGLCVLFICGLPATAVHADEVGAVAGESASSEPVSTSDALSARLESEVLRHYSGIGAEPTQEVLRDRKNGAGLMTAAFVAQGISFGTTFAAMLVGDTVVQFNWPVQLSTIPFAPGGIAGFALRYGGSNKSQRLRWTGVGLLQAAAYSGVMGALSFAALPAQDYFGPISIAAGGSYFGTSIVFLLAAAGCAEAAGRAKRNEALSQSRRSPPRSSRPALVLPTIAPRPGGLSLGLVAVF